MMQFGIWCFCIKKIKFQNQYYLYYYIDLLMLPLLLQLGLFGLLYHILSILFMRFDVCSDEKLSTFRYIHINTNLPNLQ